MPIRIDLKGSLPFAPLAPNEETIAAMMDARAGKVKSLCSVSELMAELNDDDEDDRVYEPKEPPCAD